MVPIKNAIVNNKFVLGHDASLWRSFGLSSSFGSADSIDSFGSLGADEGILIMNPGEYTIYPEDIEKPTPVIQKSKPNAGIQNQIKVEQSIQK